MIENHFTSPTLAIKIMKRFVLKQQRRELVPAFSTNHAS
jgi:hypothetical protein